MNVQKRDNANLQDLGELSPYRSHRGVIIFVFRPSSKGYWRYRIRCGARRVTKIGGEQKHKAISAAKADIDARYARGSW